MELQVPSNTTAVVLRAWVGAAEAAAPVDEIQEVSLYFTATATTGTAVTEREIRGAADAATAVVAVSEGGTVTTPLDFYFDAYHVQNGWLYLPVPEERPVIQGGTGQDNFGIQFPVAPEVSITISHGIIWGEIA